jgi:hypothetical protein
MHISRVNPVVICSLRTRRRISRGGGGGGLVESHYLYMHVNWLGVSSLNKKCTNPNLLFIRD